MATFPPICKNFGLCFANLLKCGLFLGQNSYFGIFLELFGYFWEYHLVALVGTYVVKKPNKTIWCSTAVANCFVFLFIFFHTKYSTSNLGHGTQK